MMDEAQQLEYYKQLHFRMVKDFTEQSELCEKYRQELESERAHSRMLAENLSQALKKLSELKAL